jgi:hypothetical protein
VILVFKTGEADDGFIEIRDLVSVFVVRDKLLLTVCSFITIERLNVPDSSNGSVKQTRDDEEDDWTRHWV